MTISPTVLIEDNVRMDPSRPRADGPQRRRAFRAADKLAHLTAYEQARESNGGGAYLHREGLYSSLISRIRPGCGWYSWAGIVTAGTPGTTWTTPVARVPMGSTPSARTSPSATT